MDDQKNNILWKFWYQMLSMGICICNPPPRPTPPEWPCPTPPKPDPHWPIGRPNPDHGDMLFGDYDHEQAKRIIIHSPSESGEIRPAPTWQHADRQRVYSLPIVEKWVERAGLFGNENYFIHYTVDKNVRDYPGCDCWPEPGYECLTATGETQVMEDGWQEARLLEKDILWEFWCMLQQMDMNICNPPPEDDYEDLEVICKLPYYGAGDPVMLSVELVNNGVGNKYMDSWIDCRLYGQDREEHAFSKMYIPWNEPFYVGIHARETRRIDYDIDVIIGEEIKPLSQIEDKRLIRRNIEYGNQFT